MEILKVKISYNELDRTTEMCSSNLFVDLQILLSNCSSTHMRNFIKILIVDKKINKRIFICVMISVIIKYKVLANNHDFKLNFNIGHQLHYT